MALQHLLDVPAPAKLNLFLHITGRRPDGYHLLQSVFVMIDWCDELHFERRTDGQISREDLGEEVTALPADDLVVRAARALQCATGCALGAHIGLRKTIPVQAGMGGGSSDAATTLLALNRLWDLRLPRETLQQIGITLGADVPFFLGGQPAWVEGIGDVLTPVVVPDQRYLVVKPPTGVSTAAIFTSPELKRDSSRVTIEDFAANARNTQSDEKLFGTNDLQPVAQALCPDIATGLERLRLLGLSGRMTGSGSALFAPVHGSLPESGWADGWTARLCNNLRVHPLFEWC